MWLAMLRCPLNQTSGSIDMKRAKKTSKAPAPVSTSHIIAPDDRAAAGKALRGKVPHEQHGVWKEFKGRPSPIDLLHKGTSNNSTPGGETSNQIQGTHEI